jgi:hypothetical protein
MAYPSRQAMVDHRLFRPFRAFPSRKIVPQDDAWRLTPPRLPWAGMLPPLRGSRCLLLWCRVPRALPVLGATGSARDLRRASCVSCPKWGTPNGLRPVARTIAAAGERPLSAFRFPLSARVFRIEARAPTRWGQATSFCQTKSDARAAKRHRKLTPLIQSRSRLDAEPARVANSVLDARRYSFSPSARILPSLPGVCVRQSRDQFCTKPLLSRRAPNGGSAASRWRGAVSQSGNASNAKRLFRVSRRFDRVRFIAPM